MSITNRLSIFLLLALGVALLVFSGSLYAVASWHLNAQTDRHLEAGMHALIAAIEVHPTDVEWEPLERKLPIGSDPDLATVRWSLHDEAGKLVDCSSNLNADELRQLHSEDPAWRVLTRRLRAGVFEPESLLPRDVTADVALPGKLPDDRTAVRQSFLLTVGLSEKPVAAALQNLALAMGGLSLLIWSVAGLTARWLCRRAILPITHMADEARALRSSADSDVLLHTPNTHDEVADLGNAYNQLLSSLRLSLAQQRRFAGDASHQLRTPLAAIITAVEVTLRQNRDPAEYERALNAVLKRGRELHGIVEALLLLTRFDTATSNVAVEPLELKNWCKSRLAAWQSHVRYGDIRLLELQEEAWCRSQPTLLGQVFDNLLDNALKYSDPGSMINVEVKPGSGSVCLLVRDHGHGIPAGEVEQIFDPFFRSKESKWEGVPGTGLGLTIAKRLAAAMGGELTVRSEYGSGSEFCLRLRASQPAPVVRRESPTAEPIQV